MAIKLTPPDPSGMQEFRSVFWQSWLKDLFEIIRRGVSSGNVSTNITATTSLSTDYSVLFVNATGGNITLTLPKANVLASYSVHYKIYRVDATANVVTVAAALGDTINGGASITVAGGTLKTINSDGNTKYYGY